MTIQQTLLPYDIAALEPHISASTLSYHYDKHHRGYVDKLNKLIKDTSFAGMTLEQIIAEARIGADIDILNNALQVWNHTFFWDSMSPKGGNKPEGHILELVEKQFGDVARFKQEFRDAALGLFGSGWVWLVVDGEDLSIITSGNADSPVGTEMQPLLVLDVWEHAYYLDYQNERKRYVETFLGNLINWSFAAANLKSAGLEKAA